MTFPKPFLWQKGYWLRKRRPVGSNSVPSLRALRSDRAGPIVRPRPVLTSIGPLAIELHVRCNAMAQYSMKLYAKVDSVGERRAGGIYLQQKAEPVLVIIPRLASSHSCQCGTPPPKLWSNAAPSLHKTTPSLSLHLDNGLHAARWGSPRSTEFPYLTWAPLFSC